MKKRAIKYYAPICSIFVALSLVGSTLAAWSITDNASKKVAMIRLGNIESYTVTFYDFNGDILEQKMAYEGQPLDGGAPSAPAEAGYVFDGWSDNATTYDKETESFDTKVFTQNTEYYPRYASYGYAIGDGNANYYSNSAYTAATNTSFTQNQVLKVGTYIHNKTTLDVVATTFIIPYSGPYSFGCDENGAQWSSSSASDSSKWYIDRYYTYTITDAMRINNYGLFAHFYNNSSTSTKIITDNLISGNTYYVYGPIDSANVIFGALYSSDRYSMGTNWSNVIKEFSSVTISNTYQLNAPATEKVSNWYFRGDNNGWTATSDTQLNKSFDGNNLGEFLNVSLTSGQGFKIASSDYKNEIEWYGYKLNGNWQSSRTTMQGDGAVYFNNASSGGDIKCNTDGVYNFYITSNYFIYAVKVG